MGLGRFWGTIPGTAPRNSWRRPVEEVMQWINSTLEDHFNGELCLAVGAGQHAADLPESAAVEVSVGIG
jgi:hypothetical protein